LRRSTKKNEPSGPSISPDGRRIAYVLADKLTIRDMDRIEPRVIDESVGASSPFWSPDSRAIAFFDNQALKRVSVGGGPTEEIADIGRGGSFEASGSWSRDDVIVFALPSGVAAVEEFFAKE